MRVEIKLDVKNASEVIEKNKGQFMALVADAIFSDEKLKEKVEEAIAGEMVKALDENIRKSLIEKGVEFDLQIGAYVHEMTKYNI